MVGFSSIQVTNESKFLAYWTKMCASRFPWWWTWENCAALKSWSLHKHAAMTLEMVAEAVVLPVSAWKRSSESHSNINSWSPMSHAKIIPSSIALASASSGPSGTHNFLLIAAMTCPSRATMPMPVACACLKTAPSVFILYHGLFGGDQVIVCGTMGDWNLWFALQNSSSRNVAFWMMPMLVCRVPPILAMFLSCQRLQAIATLSPTSSSLTCRTNIKCQRRSRNEPNLIPWC